jgi:hypothetical protein
MQSGTSQHVALARRHRRGAGLFPAVTHFGVGTLLTIPSGRSDIPALLALPLVAFALGILVGGGKSGSARRHALSAPGLGKRPRHTAAHEKGAHPLEVWQLECLVVEGLGRAVKAHGRQRLLSVLAPAGTARHQVFPEKDCESSRELRPLRIR